MDSYSLLPGSPGDPIKGSYGSIDTMETQPGNESWSEDSSEDPSPSARIDAVEKADDGSPRFASGVAIAPGYGSPVRLLRSSQGGAFEDGDLTSPLKALAERTHIPVADEHGHLAHYPGEEESHLRGSKYLDEQDKKEASQSILVSGITGFKCLYSFCLWLFSVVMIMSALCTKQTIATDAGVPTPVAFIIFWFLIAWLAKMEGGQACLVGLQPIDKALYAETHPRTLMSTSMAHKGDNMERFIIGRQFLVCLVVFVTDMMASTVKDVSVLGLSEFWTKSFLGSGVAVTLIAIMVGQSAQVNAANCMLDFINTYFMLFTTSLSLILDMSGLLHSVYLVQILFSKFTNTPIESDEPPRTANQNVWFWARVVFSCGALSFALSVTLSALFHGQTTMYEGVSDIVSVILLFILLCFVGVMEGMQIALFAVVNLPPDEVEGHPMAAKSCKLTFTGSNLQAFLIGRQMCVTLSMFMIARITRCDVKVGEETVFGVSESVQNGFNTGLLGAVITTVIGSLAWRIIASSFPVAFLSNPVVYAVIRLCLVVESSGICSVAWVLAVVMKQIVGYQLDEVYIGTPEERAAAAKKVDGDV